MGHGRTFIGRKQELAELNKLFKKSTASLVVVIGRRRIGKSRLIEEFAHKHKFYQFAGLPLTKKTTMQSQRNEFSLQLSLQTTVPEVIADDWTKLFILLANETKSGRVVILLDEISWMGSKDPDFLGKLKHAWDLYFKKNPQLILIICGSASVWIEKNILSSTGFLGRVSLRLRVKELPLVDCNQFWPEDGSISSYEKLKVLAVTGGVPRYLEEIRPALCAEDNIRELCFVKSGVLVNEFNEIFSDLFSNRSATCKKIVQQLANGALTIEELATKLGTQQSGFISECLDNLLESGFISRDYTWHIKFGEASKLSHFRLSDNYIRFYLKHIDKNKYKIDNDDFVLKSLTSLPGWESSMGFQFENLVLNNRQLIKQYLGLNPDDIIADNPFFQRKTLRQAGCQIDYLIHTKFNCLYVCEIKFAKDALSSTVIAAVKAKMQALSYPKGFSLRPVLIHVNGVTPELEEANFFAEIIDFGTFLTICGK